MSETPHDRPGRSGETPGLEAFAPAALAAMSEGVVIHLATGEIAACNPAAERILGLPREEILGRTSLDPLWRAVHEDGSPFPGDTHPAMVTLRTGQPARDVVMGLRVSADSTRWISVNSRPIPGAGGRPPGVVATFTDVTERVRAEGSLRASVRLLGEAEEIAGLGHYDLDVQTGTWVSSPVLDKVFGIGPDYDRSVEGWARVVHPEQRAEMTRYFSEDVVGRRQKFEMEYRIVRQSDGAERWVHGFGRLELDASGNVVRMIGTIQDVTDRKRAELEREALLEVTQGLVTTRSLRAYLALVHDALSRVIYARNFFVLLHNPRSNLFDFLYFVDEHDEAPPSVDLGRSLSAYICRTGEALFVTQELFDSLKARGEVDEVGYPSPSWLGAPLKNGDQVVGVLAVQDYDTLGRYSERDRAFFTSIAAQVAVAIERKRAEESLAASEERYRVLFENAAEGIGAVDPETGRNLYFNRSLREMFGYSEEEFTHLTIANLLPKERLEAGRRALEAIVRGESRRFSSISCVRKDGSTFEADIHGSVTIIEGRKVAFGFVTDVTGRVRLEEQLRQAQKMEAVGQLAGGIAHDFNNLVTVISGNSELLLSETPHDDPRRAPLVDIRAAGDRAASLTRQLLAFSRKQILEPRLVDLNDSIQGIEKMLRRLIGEDVVLVTDLAPEVLWIKVDPGQLEQIVMNVAVNARDAMPFGGRVSIRTGPAPGKAAPGPERRPPVILSISDTGTGMTADVKDHIFEPFFTTKGVGKGTGLGLSTVFGIVKQSGGDIRVDSEPGKGSTFTITLPSAAPPVRGRGSGAAHHALPLGTETILMVEDEEPVRRLLKRTLEGVGFIVLEARDGAEALAIAQARSEPLDILVTDVVMPGMGGRELAEKIRRERPGLRMLFMSGYTEDVMLRHGIHESGVAFLQKPFSAAELVRKVREVLDWKAAPSPRKG